MALSSLALLAMMVGLPLLFIAGTLGGAARPGSEFSLLVMGMVAAYITYLLGVYYLVGLHRRPRAPAAPAHAAAGLHENPHALRLFPVLRAVLLLQRWHVPSEALSFEALGLGIVITPGGTSRASAWSGCSAG